MKNRSIMVSKIQTKPKSGFNLIKRKNFFLFLKFYLRQNKILLKNKHNYCFLNKRNRSFIRFFGLNRNSLKLLFGKEVLPGIKKSSW